jgi:hypothetical protein
MSITFTVVERVGLLSGISRAQVRNRQGTCTSLMVFLLGFFYVQALVGCGGGGNGQSAVTVMPPMAQSAPVTPRTPESGDAWQGRYVGSVTIGDVQYFGDAMLTADGLIRLYLGGPYSNDGVLQQTMPAGSAQLVGTLQGQTNSISGDGLVFGQECAASNPIRFCAEVGHANISIAVVSLDSQDDLQGKILVTTSAGTETWSLDLGLWPNYYTQPATQGDLAGRYQEELAEFSIGGDTIIGIAADGALSFQSAGSGCTGSGQSRPHLNGAVSVYDVSLTITGCQAPYDYLNGTFVGLASDSAGTYWDYDQWLRMWLSQQDANVSGSPPRALTLLGQFQY